MFRYFPPVDWLKGYSKSLFVNDFIAALVVTALLIPQSLGYAMLAGVPVEIGLYASILPLVGYALFGTSRTLSVGPVAVLSLLTASTLAEVVTKGEIDLVTGAMSLAFLSGAILTLMGLLRLGFLANFLSHSVISGFISASGVLIALSQIKHILGVQMSGDSLIELLPALIRALSGANLPTIVIGVVALLFLFFAKTQVKPLFVKIGFSESMATSLSKTAPIFGLLLSISLVSAFELDTLGVAITGEIPSGLPRLSFSLPKFSVLQSLFLPAFFLSLIGYVESISVGKTLANKRREKIDPNQELIGLGVANLGSYVSGGLPVTGGFSRSIVNFDAGAVSQASSLMAAIGIALATQFFTPILYYLPKAVLAATIVIAVIGLLDFKILRSTWLFDKRDFWAVSLTIALTLVLGVEVGVAAGIGISLALYLHRTSNPHIAEVGLIEGTEHFRNVKRHRTRCIAGVVLIRIDESLFFANAARLEDYIQQRIVERGNVKHVVLMCSAVNDIDYSALEMLKLLNLQLCEQRVLLHLSEIKGPVMDKLQKTDFLDRLSGAVFFTQYEAFLSVEKQLLEK